MRKLLTYSADTIFSIIFQICKAYVLWYMYRKELPGIPDVETWLLE